MPVPVSAAVTGRRIGVAALGPQTAIDNAYSQFRAREEGKDADYIPALAQVDPDLFGSALVTVGCGAFTAGDDKTEVSVDLYDHSGKFGIAVVFPPLDDAGNSVRAQRAVVAISNALGGNPLAVWAR
jgi:glutaminase